MGNLSFFASKLNNSIKILTEYDNAIRHFRNKIEVNIEQHKESGYIKKLLTIITPISDVLNGNFSKSTLLNEIDIIEALKSLSKDNWKDMKDKIIKINEKLHNQNFQLKKKDFIILNDVGDAIELECNKLFNKMKQSR